MCIRDRANVIEQLQKPTLVIAHNKTLAAQLYGEFKEMFPDKMCIRDSTCTVLVSLNDCSIQRELIKFGFKTEYPEDVLSLIHI